LNCLTYRPVIAGGYGEGLNDEERHFDGEKRGHDESCSGIEMKTDSSAFADAEAHVGMSWNIAFP
jgi:hypothetical protein